MSVVLICGLSQGGRGMRVNSTTVRHKVVITINVPVVYMARDIMILMRAIFITRGIGRGGP